MLKTQVLLYRFPEKNERAEIVRQVFTDLKVEIIDISLNMLNLTLKEAFNKVIISDLYKGKDFNQEFMILGGMGDELISEIMKLISERGVRNLGPVAVVTKHNLNWSLSKLFEDLSEEHRFFMEVEKLQALIKQADLKKKDNYEEIGWNEYEKALMGGYMLLQQDSVPFESVQAAIASIVSSFDILVLKPKH